MVGCEEWMGGRVGDFVFSCFRMVKVKMMLVGVPGIDIVLGRVEREYYYISFGFGVILYCLAVLVYTITTILYS